MKDILKVMRFDYLTAKKYALAAVIVVAVLFGALSLLYSPVVSSYFTFGAMLFVIPLQSAADKNDFNKLYGILPVDRKNITRARFLYIYIVHLCAQLFELMLAAAAINLKLYRILPNQGSEMLQMIQNSFEDTKLVLIMIFGVFALFCLMFSYMEMMGQLFGRENEFKVIAISIGVLSLLALAFVFLSSHDLIPVVKLPSLPETTSGLLLLGAVFDLVMLGICILFGEITASKLAKREL